jgi:hypothetical protein
VPEPLFGEEKSQKETEEVTVQQQAAETEGLPIDTTPRDGNLPEEPSVAGYNATDTEEDEDTAMMGTETDDSALEERTEHSRYPRRIRAPPARFQDEQAQMRRAVANQADKPSVAEAMQRSDADLWREAINCELTSLREKGVYDVVPKPTHQKCLPTKMVLEVKRDQHGRVEKYKARLVALGCRQVAGVDYSEVYAPTALHASVRVLLAHAAARGYDIHQTDVKTAFLNGELSEEVYVVPPVGTAPAGSVWRLKKALYGLKQAANCWHAKLRDVLTQAGFTGSEVDPCLFILNSGAAYGYLLIHVDDALLVGPSDMIARGKQLLQSAFEIKDIGPAKYFLGLEIVSEKDGSVWVGQTRYARELLEVYGMSDCKPVVTPMVAGAHMSKDDGEALTKDVPYGELIGSLLYLTTRTRPDLAFSVGVLSRFISAPRESHWVAAKRVLRYLAGTVNFGIRYDATKQGLPEIYSDADYAGDVDDRKSTSGMAGMMHGGVVMWRAKRQSIVATSTCEAEYISASEAMKELLWLSNLLSEITGSFSKLVLQIDNQSAITLMSKRTAGVNGRTKHIDVAFHSLRHRVMRGDVKVCFVSTKQMKADIMTKALPGPTHVAAVKALGLFARSDSF